MPASRQCVAQVCLLLVVGLALAAAPPLARGGGTRDDLSLRLQAGHLLGLRVGGEALPSYGIGGFYARLYRANTGPNLLREQGLEGLPEPLPHAFAVDSTVRWRGKPTLTIKLPERGEHDSGELPLHVDGVEPHAVYLLRFAHRGERLGGDFPPIMHIRQLNADGAYATPQLNLELLNGSYDWKEQVVSVPAVENAARLELMLHHPRGRGQFWISEIALQQVKPQATMSVLGTWEGGALPRFTGVIPGTPITVDARVLPAGRVVTIQTSVSAPSLWLHKNPTALVLSFRLPLSAAGWRWGDYLRQDHPIEPGKSYSHYQIIGRRQFREVSVFPMAAVAGPEHGVALMAPLHPTLLTRMRYDGEGYLCAEFDLGLADRGRGAVDATTFSFDILRFAPRWGFRSALAAYYARYPELFASSAKQGGWWIGPSERARDLQDFGLQYAEAHFARPEPTKANNEMGLYTCSYSEPWMWRILASEENDVSQAEALRVYLPGLERDANLPATVMDGHDYWPAPRRESVRAFLNSAVYDTDGKYMQNSVRTYSAGAFIEMNTSCLPTIHSSRWGDMSRGLLSYRYETLKDAERCAAGGARLEGVYFDSIGNWSDIAAEDHRPEHFQFAKYPLTFSCATGAPVVSGLAAMAEYMQFIRQKSYITMANSDCAYAAYAAPFLDMVGAGENFSEEAAADEALSHLRSVAFRKSVSFGNTGMLSAPAAEAEARFRLLLLYNIHAGIFCSDVAALDRVRPLYQRYVPLMREMGEAGWEPVTWATADDPQLWVERYGPGPSGRSYFAVRNPTGRSLTAALRVEPSGFARPLISGISVADALTGREIVSQRSVSKLMIPIEAPPHDTVVVRVDWPR